MSLYSGLISAVKSIKEAKAVEGIKDVKGLLRKMGHAGEEMKKFSVDVGSRAARSRLAKYFAYPVAVGGGIGAGTYLATKGVAEGTKEVGEGIRRGFGFSNVKKATQTLSGVAMVLLLLLALLFVYEKTKGGKRR